MQQILRKGGAVAPWRQTRIAGATLVNGQTRAVVVEIIITDFDGERIDPQILIVAVTTVPIATGKTVVVGVDEVFRQHDGGVESLVFLKSIHSRRRDYRMAIDKSAGMHQEFILNDAGRQDQHHELINGDIPPVEILLHFIGLVGDVANSKYDFVYANVTRDPEQQRGLKPISLRAPNSKHQGKHAYANEHDTPRHQKTFLRSDSD